MPLRWTGLTLGHDVRSLALLRIGLGLYTAADAAQRILEARYYYSDFGVWPRAAAMESAGNWSWSLHFLNGTVWWQLLLLFASLSAGLAMAAGFRTGVATTVAWMLTASVHVRNILVLDGGDLVHRMLLFWAMFVPTGAVWSLDALAAPESGGAQHRGSCSVSAASAALRIQMAIILVFAALLKTGDSWRRSFDAVWIALQWDVYTTGIGVWMRQFPELLRWLTRATLLIEGFVPLVLFVPWPPLQVAAVLVLISLHAGFALAMHVLMFSVAMTIGWASFLPGWWWERLRVPLDMPHRWREALPPGCIPASRRPWFEGRPRAAAVLVLACLSYVLAWNVRALDPASLARYFPARFNFVSDLLRIDQDWSMFAPSPIREDGWLVIPGQLAGGSGSGGGAGDLFQAGAPVRWEKPPSVADTYHNRRGRKFYWAVTNANRPAVRREFARYFCREWTGPNDEPLASLEIYLMLELTGLDHTVAPPEKQLVWPQTCQ